MTLYSAVLFFVLTPGVFLRIPKKGSLKLVALVHAIVFAIIYYLTCKFVWLHVKHEGFESEMKSDSTQLDLTIKSINASISSAEAALSQSTPDLSTASSRLNDALAQVNTAMNMPSSSN